MLHSLHHLHYRSPWLGFREFGWASGIAKPFDHYPPPYNAFYPLDSKSIHSKRLPLQPVPSPRATISLATPRDVRLRHPCQLHAILNDVAMISMVAGTVAIFMNKGKAGKAHFISWHSWVGLLTLALWAISIASAALNTVDLKGKRLWYLWRSRTHR